MLPATFATCITVVANATFNYVFIYGYGSFEGLGFIGTGPVLCLAVTPPAALTVFTLYAVVIRGYHKDYWFGWSMQSISWGRLHTFLELGTPTALSAVVDSLSGAVAGSFAGLAGTSVAAAQNVCTGLFSLSYSTVSGFSTATQIRRAHDSGKPESAKRILKLGSATLLLGGVVVCLVLGVAHNKVWQIWSSDPELIALCNSTLVAFMASVMTCYCRFLLAVVSVSLGPKEARVNLVANNIASWLIYIPLAYIMPIKWGWGLPGFWWSDWSGEIFKVVVLSWSVSQVDWAQASREAQERAGMDVKQATIVAMSRASQVAFSTRASLVA
ncbi:hypothetical protein EMIHUDRAFT_213069 [Emiliania huxleyi CCMP1516]|uniref:MATE efflux family protein n=2 Tax=Emiliania huxleyi TaxID=2903 RepID=A0A0D3INM3_EMIH1|nr:hypothetical protein EMIHUDRAFT_213069 [Emiliania huxleyi CCMP1516]EOD12858.1 hypothetical protein EMIHUDRAFT_213069 [Emiliania huxleyi CCMP1516]|eukprot:XP_005765287.1 hypothetical protein EMIHUDRAFT_213069 [Emiliania huxleyi CCMP1516]